MIDLNKLAEVSQGDAQRAEAELDRMIDVHQKKADYLEYRVKQYLLTHAIKEDAGEWYLGNQGSAGCQWAIQLVAVEALKGLKEKLQAEEEG